MICVIHNRNTLTPNSNRPGRRAFTLAEVMLSLSIMAVLMVAAATAMKVSMQGYDENDKITRAMQGARATLERLTRQLRTAEDTNFTQTSEPGTYQGQSVTMDVTTLVITSPKDNSYLQQVQYVHRIPMGSTSGGKLYYYYQEQGQGLTTPALAMLGEEEDVEVESFDVTTVSQGASTANTKVQFTLNVGGRQFDFSSAVALRGNEY
jgi:prepilin-type N-terminal cleavage/methylation domain-containing protein